MNAHTLRCATLLLVAAVAGCSRKESATVTAPASSAPVAAAPASAAASGPIIAPQALERATDSQRQLGATLASQGGGNGIPPCSSCHGPQGEGQATFPRIAGQSFVYLKHELESYADETRMNPAMQPIAKAMSRDQRAAGAAYYASLGASAPAGVVSGSGTGQARGNERGRQLAERGDESKFVQACANCHGPDGIGSGYLYPYLAGQREPYLVTTLGNWRDGTRHNDPTNQMPIIAKALADTDVQAVAAYYAQLPPPPPRDADVVAATPAAGAASAVVSGPRPGAQAPQGVGTQQGALTGGSQGPGGGGAGSGGGPGGSPTGESTTTPGASAPASAPSR
jgi:cytochrome c553